MNRNKGWIGVDLDKTLAQYDDIWRGVDYIGAPIAAMVERVQLWLADGKNVRIFTARVCFDEVGSARSAEEAARARAVIQAWCVEHIGCVLPVTNVKDFNMIELWDDRCVQVEPNTGARVVFDTPPCPACGEGALCTVKQDDKAIGIGCFECGASFLQTKPA